MRIEGRLSPAEIRRALAECMTLANIDEAMDWDPGTARRLRWSTGPERLPFADTELGGVPIWFRSTIEAWQATLPEPDPEPEADEPEPEPEPDEAEAEPDEAEAEPDEAEAPEEEPAEPDEPEEPGEHDEPDDAEDADEEPAEPEPEPDPARIHSGFELRPGQHVTANIHGRWRDAVVTHRDRATVAVDYNLDDTPLGLRRQRISIDRIRLPD